MKYVLENDNFFTRILHGDTAMAVQRRLHFEGMLTQIFRKTSTADPKNAQILRKKSKITRSHSVTMLNRDF